MDILHAHDLTRLADQRGGTRISLFLPTHRGGPQTGRNHIRLKNLLQHAQHTLHADGMRAGQIDTVLAPAHNSSTSCRYGTSPATASPCSSAPTSSGTSGSRCGCRNW